MPSIKLSIKENYSPLEVFLKDHRTFSGEGKFTHTSITGPPASYFIDQSEQDQFLNLLILIF